MIVVREMNGTVTVNNYKHQKSRGPGVSLGVSFNSSRGWTEVGSFYLYLLQCQL
jgi:hypothetical protein